jgi:pimeloyl-ACP methyl ester carboxylesterase
VLEAPHVVVEDLTVQSIAALRDRYRLGGVRDRLARHHAHVDEAFEGWAGVWLSAEFRGWDIRPRLAAIQCAVLLIQGREDEYGTLAQLDAIEAELGRPPQRVVIQNCGHSPHRDQPARVLDEAARFLAGSADFRVKPLVTHPRRA